MGNRKRRGVGALEEKVRARDAWAPELVQMLATPIASATGNEFEESLAVVRRRRSNRKGPRRTPPRP